RRPPSQPNPIAAFWRRRSDAANDDAPREPMRELIEPGGLDPIARLLAVNDLVPERPRALLGAGLAGQAEKGGLQPLMEYVLERHPDVGLGRGRELAFLANTLVAGCEIQSRSFTPAEASQ